MRDMQMEGDTQEKNEWHRSRVSLQENLSGMKFVECRERMRDRG